MAFLLTDRLAAKPLEVLFGGAAGGGKGTSVHPLRYLQRGLTLDGVTADLPEGNVLTPFGFRPIGDLKVGDQVCNPDGTVATVRRLHFPGVKPMYRVTMADGSSTIAFDEHIWAYSVAGVRKRRKKPPPDLSGLKDSPERWNAEVMTRCSVTDTLGLKELVERAIDDRERGKRPRYVQLPMVRPQAQTQGKGRGDRLSPYIIGAFIGDGALSGSTPTIAGADRELFDRIERELPSGISLGWHQPRLNPKTGVTTLHAGLVGTTESEGESAAKLFERDHLWGKRAWEKSIPPRLLSAPEEDRWALAQGLFDTDGYMDDRGHIEYVTVSERLAKDVQHLVRSLGFRATLTPKVTTYEHGGEKRKGRLAYRLYIQGTEKTALFHLPRKVDRAAPFNGNDVILSHRVESVEFVGNAPSMCIEVDHPNHLYVADDFIVTHNSDALLMAALTYADVPGYSALILRRTFNDLNEPGALMDRARKWLGPTDAKPVRGGREWVFPSGARLVFGHVQFHREAEEQFSGAEFQYIGIDELTRGWEQRTYEFLLSRIRRPSDVNSWRMEAASDGTTLADVPLRMRVATNPGGSGHCVREGEVLTPDRGWVDIRDMRSGDKIFSLAEDGRMFETAVDQWHRYDIDESLVRVEARGLFMEMTEGHRVAKVGGGRGRESQGKAFQLRTFAELPGQATILRSAVGGWKGTPLAASREWMELLGWFIAEGSTVDRSGGWVSIAQMKQRGRDRIKYLLDTLGWTYTETDSAFNFYGAERIELFSSVGKRADLKFIPDWVKAASQEQLQALLDGLMGGDGHWQSEHGGTFYTASQRLAEDFSEVALKCGYIVKMSERDRRGESAGTNGRGQEIIHRHTSHEVSIKRTRSGGTEILTGNHLYDVDTETKRRTDVSRIPYSGSVYCIGVPDTHNFLIRQRGSVWISGNSWVKRRFVDPETREHRIFIPSLLKDNPHLNQEEYENALMQLDPVTRERLLNGDWDIVESGAVFSRDTFKFVPDVPKDHKIEWARCWDFAATDADAKDEPDWTVGALVGMDRKTGLWYLRDVQRTQSTAEKVEGLVYATAMTDGRKIPIILEQEPGSAGKLVLAHFRRNILQGFEVHGDRPTGPKPERARPWAAAASSGNFFIVSHADKPAAWVSDFFAEIELFPTPRINDDQVDAVSGAFNWLAENRRGGGLIA